MIQVSNHTRQKSWLKMPDHSRVWVYQANRSLSESEEQDLENELNHFIGGWNAHGSELKASHAIFFGRFVVLFVDEEMQAPSGCSIDKSVHLLSKFGQKLNVDFFERMVVALWKDGNIEDVKIHDLWAQMKADLDLKKEDMVFDNLIQTKEDIQHWIKPIKDSWHMESFQR